MDTSFVHPFISIVAGPTGFGKTTFVESLLRHSHTLVNLPPEKDHVLLRRMAAIVFHRLYHTSELRMYRGSSRFVIFRF